MTTSASALEDTCPACNRFIGTFLECPYCGIESSQRFQKRTFRFAALFLSVSGLMTLLALGMQASPLFTSFTQLCPMMNHGYVTLTGTVINTPELHGNPEAPQSVSFDLADTGGRITVIAAQRTTRDLLARNKLPDAHSQVHVTGHLYLVAGKTTRLYLDSASSLNEGTVTP